MLTIQALAVCLLCSTVVTTYISYKENLALQSRFQTADELANNITNFMSLAQAMDNKSFSTRLLKLRT